MSMIGGDQQAQWPHKTTALPMFRLIKKAAEPFSQRETIKLFTIVGVDIVGQANRDLIQSE